MKGARNKEKRIYVLLFHLNTILKNVKSSVATESRSVFAWMRTGKGSQRKESQKGTRRLLEVGVDMFTILIFGVVSWCIHISEFIKLYTLNVCSLLNATIFQ